MSKKNYYCVLIASIFLCTIFISYSPNLVKAQFGCGNYGNIFGGSGFDFSGWSNSFSFGGGWWTPPPPPPPPITQYLLSVSKSGSGTGTVQGGGINCGSACSRTYNTGTVVVLTANSSSNSNFIGWSGSCSGAGTCIVTMSGARSVSANFQLKTYTLSVSKSGNGTGIIQGGGINCGSTCSRTYNSGTVVVLTVNSSSDSNFTGWSGSCLGTGNCTIIMNIARSVNADFGLSSDPIDCQVSWSEWSQCSVLCGRGYQTRTGTIIAEPKNGGAECPSLEEIRECTLDPCPGINCEVLTSSSIKINYDKLTNDFEIKNDITGEVWVRDGDGIITDSELDPNTKYIYELTKEGIVIESVNCKTKYPDPDWKETSPLGAIVDFFQKLIKK